LGPPNRIFARYAAAAGLVALSTVAAELLFRLTESPRLSMVFLAAVLVTAYVLGSGPAYFAAGLAFLVYNFYLVEPRFTFSFESEDALTLAVFLAVAMLTGNLTGRVRDQAARAEARARTTDALFRATREFSALSEERVIREKLAEHLAAAARGAAFVRDGAHIIGGPDDLALPRELQRAAETLEQEPGAGSRSVTSGGWTLRTLRTAGQSLGVVGWRESPEHALSLDEQTLLEILADTGAAAVARARLTAAKAEAEARARTEDLRNALLSSVSHDLRTPLAAILASASSLEQFGEAFEPGVRRDLAATIQEEAERLDAFVANLLNMTRVEAGALSVHAAPFSAAEVVTRTVERRARTLGRAAHVTAPADLAEALGDPGLFEQALGNVVENAMRHTPPATAVEVQAWAADGEVIVEVTDAGAGVAPNDLPRIFDKFYRGGDGGGRPGTGLGLSITRGLMEGMGGAVSARNRQAPDHGLAVTFRLPAAP
jgi:two-component system sensor histidine kinase KdpD